MQHRSKALHHAKGDVTRRGKGRSPNQVDVFVGQRIKQRRRILGLSQEELGQKLGLTFQQVQKYEKGVNRVCVSRLYGISRVLCLPISQIFEGLESVPLGQAAQSEETEETRRMIEEDELLGSRESAELVRSLTTLKVSNPHWYACIAESIRTFSEPEAQAPQALGQ
jgi:transcriptional regulator with XRE-family HTH domain